MKKKKKKRSTVRNVSDKRKFLDLEAENTSSIRNVIGLNQELSE